MNIFEKVKESISFEEIARHHGVEFNRANKSICPLHDEKNESFHNYITHGYCFGCGKFADVIDLESRFTGQSPLEAALSLAKRYGISLPEFSPKDRERFDKQAEAYMVLEKLAAYANEKIKQHPDVMDFLAKKALDESGVDKWKIGYIGEEALVSRNLLGLNQRQLSIAREIGLINKHGKDHFRNRIIYPFRNYGKIVFLSGRAHPEVNPIHLHLPNSELIQKPIAFKENLQKDDCIIVESFTDALAFIDNGFPACALAGTHAGDEGKTALSKAKGKFYFCPDPDKPGEENFYQLAKEYKGNIIGLQSTKDPDETCADLKQIGPNAFKERVQEAIQNAKYYLDLMIERESIKEVLKEIFNLEMDSTKDIWLNTLAEHHKGKGVTTRSLRKDLAKLAKQESDERLAEENQITENQDPLNKYSEEEKQQAQELLSSPDILAKVVDITKKAGYVKEERNKKLAYLAYTSRKLHGKQKAISLIGKGPSGSGKSELLKAVVKLIPPEDFEDYTFITEKALLHSEFDLSHKILCIFEREGGEKANYTIRTAISEGKLKILTVIKDPITGNWKTIKKEIPAEGLVYIETTTDEYTEIQNASRTFEFFTDSSPETTREVLRTQAKNHVQHEENLEKEYRIWRCAQDMLEPLPVYIPFAEQLAEAFPVDQIRARRDFPRLLALIETSALLHQKTRDRKEIEGNCYVIATEQDFDIAHYIIKPILSQTYKEISPKEEALIKIITEEYGIGAFADPDIPGSKDINVFAPRELNDKIQKRIAENKKDDIAREFKAQRTLKEYIGKLAKKSILEWNGEKGVRSKYVLVSGIPQISFDISDVRLSSTPARSTSSNLTIQNHSQNADTALDIDEDVQSMSNVPLALSTPKTLDMGHTSDMDVHVPPSPYGTLDNLGIGQSDMDYEAKRQDTIKEGGSNPKDGLDFSKSKPQSDYEIQEIRYSDEDIVYQLERRDKDGKPLIRIVTPDCRDFEDVRREYEKQTR